MVDAESPSYDEDKIVWLTHTRRSGIVDHLSSSELTLQFSQLDITPNKVKAPPTNKLAPKSSSKARRNKKAKKNAHDTALDSSSSSSPSPIFTVIDDNTSVGSTAAYEEASWRISQHLANPAPADKSGRLSLLHDFIVELGLLTYDNALPTSLTSARAFIKTHAHIHITDYLNARQLGPDAIKAALHPSRSALVKSIKEKGAVFPRKKAKEKGLNVFLIQYLY